MTDDIRHHIEWRNENGEKVGVVEVPHETLLDLAYGDWAQDQESRRFVYLNDGDNDWFELWRTDLPSVTSIKS